MDYAVELLEPTCPGWSLDQLLPIWQNWPERTPFYTHAVRFYTMTTSEIATVLAWHDALNASEVDTLVALSSDDIEVGDAHGAAQGHAALREWASGHPRHAEVGKIYVHDGVVVVEQNIGGPGESGSTIASAFRVVHDHVTSVFRHDGLAAALAATELTDADLID